MPTTKATKRVSVTPSLNRKLRIAAVTKGLTLGELVQEMYNVWKDAQECQAEPNGGGE